MTDSLRRRRGIVLDQVLRGAAYGAGTSVVSVIIVWWDSRH
ncbi:hypothetical protein ACFPK5_06525 [Streptomyces beijiangensis]